ncbi:MAG: peptidoglycan DD-metalloendopeptidase family protein [Gemmatimonadota bacterium]
MRGRSWEGEARLGGGNGRGPVVLGVLGVCLALIALGAIGVLAVRGWRVQGLEAEVARLESERERLQEIERLLVEVEDAYAVLRSLFEPGARSGGAGTIHLPVPASVGAGAAGATDEDGRLPTTWPLTEAGFLTQPLVEGAGADHPGIDVAAPTGSYIRVSGPGTVFEAAEDPVYGLYVVVDHGEGYRSLYAHASLLLVEAGQQVSRGEVIALSGSTGRSTAPHLHFEILRDGEPLDPLSLVRRP